MFWLLTPIAWAICIPIFLRKERYHRGEYIGIPCFVTAVQIFISCIVFFSSLKTTADIDAFYLANFGLLNQAVVETRNAVIPRISSGSTDLGIQLENNQQSQTNSRVVGNLIYRTNTYNEDVVFYQKLRKVSWLLYPFLNFPEKAELLYLPGQLRQ